VDRKKEEQDRERDGGDMTFKKRSEATAICGWQAAK
jgi:hypothetical protein